ncbi:MAG: pyruvate kinase, partial [Acidimicrobiales bacterium]
MSAEKPPPADPPATPRRRTKIVATIGPASDGPTALVAMAAAGMDVARVTLAHGTIEEALDRVRSLRAVVPEVAVLVDLPGPKIRAAPFAAGGVVLATVAEVALVAAEAEMLSTATLIGVAHTDLVASLVSGDAVALGDGGVALVVIDQHEG